MHTWIHHREHREGQRRAATPRPETLLEIGAGAGHNAFLLRDGTDVRSVHDRHVEGVFPRATWVRLLEEPASA